MKTNMKIKLLAIAYVAMAIAGNVLFLHLYKEMEYHQREAAFWPFIALWLLIVFAAIVLAMFANTSREQMAEDAMYQKRIKEIEGAYNDLEYYYDDWRD